VLFLPGFLGSELACEHDGNRNLVWPGSVDGVKVNSDIGALGIINTIQGGKVESQTTSSKSCGAKKFEQGSVALNDPQPVSATWCIPESSGAIGPGAHSCAVYQTPVYSELGITMQDTSEQLGRPFEAWAWDWRLDPRQQVPRLHETIVNMRQQTGAKVTVLAHSFGNTLFEAWIDYVEAKGEQAGDYVGRFVGAGSPWWGVTGLRPDVQGELQPGLVASVLSHIIGNQLIASTFSSMPGPYHLLPTRWYDEYIAQQNNTKGQGWLAAESNDGKSYWVPYNGVGQTLGAALDSCPQQETFPCQAQKLYDESGVAERAEGFNRSGIADWVQIVGSGVPTTEQFCLGCTDWPSSNQKRVVKQQETTDTLTTSTSGDELVPVFSAIRGSNPRDPAGDDVDFFFTCGIKHTALVTDQSILDQLAPYLWGDGVMSYGGVFSDEPCAQSS